VIVAQAELDAILNRKIRKRVLELPVRHGSLGELKRCPMRRGGVYHLKPPLPFDRLLARAEQRRPRKEAVLWLIGRVERWEPKPVTITVSHEPERQGDIWFVRFLKGDEAELLDDSSLFLSGDGGFTSIASRQAVPGDPPYCPPFAEDLERARQAAREKRLTPAQAIMARMKADAETCRDAMVTVKAGNRARLIAKEIAKLQAEVALDNGATLSRSDRAASQAPVDAEDEPRPRGTESGLRP
jgi:hypothetical protein